MASPPKLGSYHLVRHLAMGGMGEVWLARQEGLAGFSRPVVIKRVLRSHNNEPRFIEMFLHEARLAARLVHPNIVQVIELGSQDGEWFMAMEFVPGVTLRTLQKTAQKQGQVLDPACVAGVASQALVGLHHAHQLKDEAGAPLQLVHRDVSPDNLMLSYDGVVKVLDFGIARATTAIATTNPGAVRGKLAYLSPELILGEPADCRSDVFAVGVVLYELLTGQRPFEGESDGAKMMRVVQHLPPPPTSLVPGLPPVLSELIMRALEKKPADRFASAEAMHDALEEALLSLRQRVGPPRLAAWMKSVVGEPATLDLTPAPATATFSRPRAVATPAGEVPSRRAVRGLLALGVLVTLALTAGVVWVRSRPVVAVEPLPLPTTRVVAAEALPLPTTPVVEAEPGPPVVEADAGSPPPTLAVKPRATGRVQLLIKPWAEVYLNGRSLGLTPLAPLSLPAGRTRLTLRNDRLGVEREVWVTVRADSTVTVRENLLP